MLNDKKLFKNIYIYIYIKIKILLVDKNITQVWIIIFIIRFIKYLEIKNKKKDILSTHNKCSEFHCSILSSLTQKPNALNLK